MSYSKKVRRHVIHKITMALHLRNRSWTHEADPEEIKRLPKDAIKMVNIIEDEYSSKGAAAAMWLAKKLQDDDWVDTLQEQSWKKS